MMNNENPGEGRLYNDVALTFFIPFSSLINEVGFELTLGGRASARPDPHHNYFRAG